MNISGCRPVGLDDGEISASRQKHGANIMTQRRKKSFARKLWSNLGDPVIRILLAALAVNIVFTFRGGDWMECVGIAVSVALATFISTLSEHGSENAFEKLNAEAGQEYCRVRRRRGIEQIKSSDVVVGDVVLLSPGDKIPADGLLFSGELSVDQSAMTGESREVKKRPSGDSRLTPDAPSAVLRGCAVMSGEGEAVIIAVGDKTALGEISREVQSEMRDSPLKIRLAKLARQISVLGYIMATLIALVSLADALLFDSGFRSDIIMLKLTDWHFMVETLLHSLTMGLTVLVVSVPEGLPMMIAVVLSANIRRMVKDKVLVRRPVGIESAGSMNILFTDKTGTLTEGVLSVGEIYAGDGKCFTSVDKLRAHGGVMYTHFCDSCLLNNSAERTASGISGGNATDRALMSCVPNTYKVDDRAVKRLPFDSAKKYSSARLSDGRVLIKGAPELILPYVQNRLLPDGTCVSVDAGELAELVRRINRGGVRTLLLAEGRRGMETHEFGALTLIALVTLNDKIRREAPDSVAELRGAGIHVVMITGDSLETGEAIARQCGILGGGVDICLDGRELSALSDMKLGELLPRIGVIARALPADKSRLVRVAQSVGLVVGMTGDGINDAPALRHADIGFAMGAGTQVAREAGDIIIVDNRLSSICRAVLYGRNIFKSIRKFITLQLTMNLCAVGVSMIGPFIGIDAPVTVVQMLWVNLIMDTLGGLAFAGEPALPSCMKERPKRRDEPILNKYMMGQIILLGGFTIALCLAFLKLPAITSLYRPAPDNIYLLTAFFALFIFSSVFNCFNARTDRISLFAGITKNRAFVLIMSAVLAVQLVFVYVGGSVLRTAPLTGKELLITMLLSLLVFPADFLRKLLWRFFVGKRGY
ncbi:MAG: calcium-translocating P-type ATPase, PMCA-type [Clostridia bacterium]|nr:calcium-translocating P-type ATPase, PMCA-type [Clostridia bacterium]